MIKNIAIALGLLILGAAFGRWASPTKVVEKEVIKYQDKIVEKVVYKKDTNEHKHKVTVSLVTIKPDGTKTIETKVYDDDNIQITQDSTTNKIDVKTGETTKEKTTDYARDNYSVLASRKFNIDDKSSDWGISFNKRFLGPIYLGAFAFTDKTIGASVGLSF